MARASLLDGALITRATLVGTALMDPAILAYNSCLEGSLEIASTPLGSYTWPSKTPPKISCVSFFPLSFKKVFMDLMDPETSSSIKNHIFAPFNRGSSPRHAYGVSSIARAINLFLTTLMVVVSGTAKRSCSVSATVNPLAGTLKIISEVSNKPLTFSTVAALPSLDVAIPLAPPYKEVDDGLLFCAAGVKAIDNWKSAVSVKSRIILFVGVVYVYVIVIDYGCKICCVRSVCSAGTL
mmetsp:Transcript_11627/g.25950  ORF Transcript_11627/g.25950 Transcript_11627/m.25950 type:complete len:238 (-) Transcript_11627:102-815(-)